MAGSSQVKFQEGGRSPTKREISLWGGVNSPPDFTFKEGGYLTEAALVDLVAEAREKIHQSNRFDLRVLSTAFAASD